jgi:photosystem II stability/assembly factor-like uncharacterized protein
MISVGYVYYTSTYWSQFSVTADGGLTWYRDTLDSCYRANTAVFDPHLAGRVYLAGDSNWNYPYLKVSNDTGHTWTRLGSGLSGSVLNLCLAPNDPNLMFCGTTAGLYKSTDGGATWTRKGTMTNVRSVVVDTIDASIAYCGCGTGVFASSDGGETWTPFNTGLGVTDVLSLVLRSGPDGELFAGTNGGSVYRTELSSGVAERHASARPMNFTLLPNPCPGSAVLSSDLSVPACVTVSDVTGRRVWTEMLAPGVGHLKLPTLSAGVYVVRLATGSGSATRKLVVQN